MYNKFVQNGRFRRPLNKEDDFREIAIPSTTYEVLKEPGWFPTLDRLKRIGLAKLRDDYYSLKSIDFNTGYESLNRITFAFGSGMRSPPEGSYTNEPKESQEIDEDCANKICKINFGYSW